jgi:hypothetical protein
MKYYIKNEKVWEELIVCLQKYLKPLEYTENINEANIIIFNNFHINDRKFLLKNKNLFNEKKFFCYIHEPLTDNDDYDYNKKMLIRLKVFKFINIISYSKKNLEIAKNILGERQFFYLPINFYLEDEETFNKTINLSILHRNFIKDNSHKHYNQKILPINNLKKYNISFLNQWGVEREIFF